ncbi:Zn-dependent hydrolase [Niallia nealsonii]|uniref:Zn-dependent hydrolase n=2 Tax=Niallia nealsonii TaxID=115979 RepID=A0A2N0Z5J9_9BACI|nr:Zn-dependent hydrolase [Niallia nealsonii]
MKTFFDEIAKINSGTKGYTRLAFSEEEKSAKEWLIGKCQELNLKIRRDSADNIYARLGDGDKPALLIGSHLDTVPEGGLYDGALGVLTGLEALETIIESKIALDSPVELVCFTGEEANPLGGTFGSRTATGLIDFQKEKEEELKQFGFTIEELQQAKMKKEDYLGFVELHIEQGEVLEKNQKNIGIVTSIAGIKRFKVEVFGKPSHSGTTPMTLRSDALVESSKIIQVVNEIAANYGNEMVATVGEFSIKPNLANVVPGYVSMLVEVRGKTWEDMQKVVQQIQAWIKENTKNTTIVDIVEKKPNSLNERIQQVIEEACIQLGYSYRYMISGANHDANSMTYITDAGMIFVPSKDGLSHHPDEYTSWEEIEKGGNVLLKTILTICSNKGE